MVDIEEKATYLAYDACDQFLRNKVTFQEIYWNSKARKTERNGIKWQLHKGYIWAQYLRMGVFDMQCDRIFSNNRKQREYLPPSMIGRINRPWVQSTPLQMGKSRDDTGFKTDFWGNIIQCVIKGKETI